MRRWQTFHGCWWLFSVSLYSAFLQVKDSVSAWLFRHLFMQMTIKLQFTLNSLKKGLIKTYTMARAKLLFFFKLKDFHLNYKKEPTQSIWTRNTNHCVVLQAYRPLNTLFKHWQRMLDPGVQRSHGMNSVGRHIMFYNYIAFVLIGGWIHQKPRCPTVPPALKHNAYICESLWSCCKRLYICEVVVKNLNVKSEHLFS